ncbi:hypothetical protein Gotur_027107 [Gossypium turneri]
MRLSKLGLKRHNARNLSSPKLWGTLMKQLLIYSTGVIRGLHQSQRFWQKPSGH